MDKKRIQQRVIISVLKLTNQINQFESTPRSFGTDQEIYPSEIHTIEAIGNNNESNVTNLSSIMGIKKSSVSEIIKKLEKKELVTKFKRKDNKKEIIISLSEKGSIAYENHRLYHKEMYESISSYMNNISNDVLEKFCGSLEEINNHLDKELKIGANLDI